MAGYSGTPLAKKLGIKDGFYVQLINAPDDYLCLFTDLPANVYFENHTGGKLDLIHLFSKSLDEYRSLLAALKNSIKPNGIIWVSWPKKSSKVPTDISENSIRTLALHAGLVDIKVCAVDQTWSALKLVIPLKDRQAESDLTEPRPV